MKPNKLIKIKVLKHQREEYIVINKYEIRSIEPAQSGGCNPEGTKSIITMNYLFMGYNDEYITPYTVEELWEILEGLE